MLKIRLRRMGAIRQPHYRIVVADARAPRDGAFIESLGHYNPLTNPSTIQIDLAKYEEWKRKGAQPTEAVVGLISQLNKAAAAAAAEGTATAEPADRRTRTASGKRSVPEVTAAAPEAAANDDAATEAAPEAALEAAPSADEAAPEAAAAPDAGEDAGTGAAATGDEA